MILTYTRTHMIKWILRRLQYYTNRYLSTKIVFIADLVVSVLASVCTIVSVHLLNHDVMDLSQTAIWIAAAAIYSVLLSYFFKTFTIVIRHSTLRQLSRFAALAILKAAALALTYSLIVGMQSLILVLAIVDFVFTLSFLLFLRLAMILVYDAVKSQQRFRFEHKRVLVYATGEKSVSVVTRLQGSKHYYVAGFIAYGAGIPKSTILDKRIFHFTSQNDISLIKRRFEIDAILYVSDDDVHNEQERLIAYSEAAKLKSLIVPSIDELVGGKLSQHIRDIEIEDLLMRAEIKISMDEIIANFKGKTVMVTGAAGSIGSELCRQLATFGVKELVLYDNAETPMHNLRLELEETHPELSFIPVIGDVRLPARLDYAFRKWRPQVVFHAAAYKHVPLMEENPCEAVYVNVAGSRNVADKCLEYDVEKMVMVSTDKAVNPTNIMGCTKRLAEIYVQSMGLAIESGKKAGKTRFVTTRFGNVLGSNGSVIPRFREQIAKGGPVTVTHPEITRFFMTIPEACRLVMEAATMSTGNQIFVFDMGESVKIDQLARRMIHLAGLVPDVDIKIEYSGLRPGEKLYEEVLANSENTIPTNHKRINIAKVREYDYDDALQAMDTLETLAREVDIQNMVRLMKQIVPEFISKNSRFEIFDNQEN